jgi:pyruvate, orthophosphate dikinase
LCRSRAYTFRSGKALLPANPFVTIDRKKSKGEVIMLAAERGKRTRTNTTLGIVVEYGGNPTSIALDHEAGQETQ